MTKQTSASSYDRGAFWRRYERYKRQVMSEPARFKLPRLKQRWADRYADSDPRKALEAVWQRRTWEAMASVIDAARNERDEISFAEADVAAAVMSMSLLEWQSEAQLGSVYFAEQRTDLYADLLFVGERRFNFNIGGRLAEADGLHAPSGESIRVIVEQVLEANQKNYTPVVIAAARFWRFIEAQRKLLQRRLRSGAIAHEFPAQVHVFLGGVAVPKAGNRWWLILE